MFVTVSSLIVHAEMPFASDRRLLLFHTDRRYQETINRQDRSKIYRQEQVS